MLDIGVALQLIKMLTEVSCCLFLPSEQYEQVITVLHQLGSINLICFDSNQANQNFYNYIKKKEEELDH